MPSGTPHYLRVARALAALVPITASACSPRVHPVATGGTAQRALRTERSIAGNVQDAEVVAPDPGDELPVASCRTGAVRQGDRCAGKADNHPICATPLEPSATTFQACVCNPQGRTECRTARCENGAIDSFACPRAGAVCGPEQLCECRAVPDTGALAWSCQDIAPGMVEGPLPPPTLV